MENIFLILGGGGGSGVEKMYVTFNSYCGVAQASRAFIFGMNCRRKITWLIVLLCSSQTSCTQV